MNKYLKWTLWISGALLLAAAFFAIGYFTYTHWNNGGWMMSERGEDFWEGNRRLPWREMPMSPNFVRPDRRMFGFSPLGFILGGLFRLAIPVLIILGVIALIQYLRRSNKVVPVPTMAAPAPEFVPAPVEQSKTCSSCGRAIQTDWSHCPYCGNTLS